ncbi:hypothetical protein FQZ97_1037120 [compost metagenome]
MPSSLASTIPEKVPAVMSQIGSLPVMTEVSRFPSAPTPSAMIIETRPMASVLISLAPSTRLRWGTSVNVVSAVRWLHSLVTASTPMIGSTIDMGEPIAAAKSSKSRVSRSPRITVRAVAMTEVMTMLAISQ